MPDSKTEMETLKAENELLKIEVEGAKRLAAHENLIREAEFYKTVTDYH